MKLYYILILLLLSHAIQQFFSQESHYQNKLDDLAALSERLSPTLSPEAKEGVKEELGSLQSRLSDVMMGARACEEKQHKYLGDWQDFVGGVGDVEKALYTAQQRGVYSTPTSLPQAQDNTQLSKVHVHTCMQVVIPLS